MNIEKKIHKGWEEYNKNEQLQSILGKCMFGKYQYICSSDKGVISIIELPDYLGDGYDWEIYQLRGSPLFDDVIRFESYEKAIEKCKELLE